jgi:hypothetical protein
MKPKIQTWLRQIELGNIKSNHAKVLNYLKKKETFSNIHRMRIELNMAHQSLTATISILMDYGLIKSVGDGVVIRGNTYSEFMFVKEEWERELLQHMRKKEKFKQWLAKGIDDYTQLLPLDISIKIQDIYFNKL